MFLSGVWKDRDISKSTSRGELKNFKSVSEHDSANNPSMFSSFRYRNEMPSEHSRRALLAKSEHIMLARNTISLSSHRNLLSTTNHSMVNIGESSESMTLKRRGSESGGAYNLDPILGDGVMRLQAERQAISRSALYTSMNMIFFITTCCIYLVFVNGWSIRDSLFFINYSFTTVGFGSSHDIPTEQWQQFLTTVFVLVGVGSWGLFLSQFVNYLKVCSTTAQNKRHRLYLTQMGIEMAQHFDDNTPDPIYGAMQTRQCTTRVLMTVFDCFDKMTAFIERNSLAKVLFKFFVPFAGFLVLMGVIIGSIEGWTFIESIYWSSITFTTVGFGDYIPKNSLSQWITIVFLPLSNVFVSFFLTNVMILKFEATRKNNERLARKLRKQQEDAQYYQNNENSSSFEIIDMEDGRPSKAALQQLLDKCEQEKLAMEDNSSFCNNSTNEQHHDDQVTTAAGILFGHNINITKKQQQEGLISKSESLKSSNKTAVGSGILTTPQQLAGVSFLPGGEKDQSSGGSTTQASSAGLPSVWQNSVLVRLKVRKYLARIIVTDVVPSFHFLDHTSPNHDSSGAVLPGVRVASIRHISDKWKIPRKALQAFEQLAIKSILFIGLNDLNDPSFGERRIVQSESKLLNQLFPPFYASMGSVERLMRWVREVESVEGWEYDSSSSSSEEDSDTDDDNDDGDGTNPNRNDEDASKEIVVVNDKGNSSRCSWDKDDSSVDNYDNGFSKTCSSTGSCSFQSTVI